MKGSSARGAAIDLARRGAFEVKTVISRYPALAIPIARRRHGDPFASDTELVIEGFPRTGTSFAVAAFRLAQPGSVRLASHVHAPAQLIAAVRGKVAALAVVREPEDTVLSFVIRNPHLSIGQALRGYLRFYEPLLPYLDRLVVGTFDQVTTGFGAVTRRVNARFGTGFAEFEHTEENVARCFKEIEEDYLCRLPEGEALERQVARPSAWRDQEKERLRASYGAAPVAPLRSRAERAFRRFADVAGP